MIRKIFGVLNNQYLDDEGHLKVFKAACRLGEHICTDIIVHHQNRQELLLKFWSTVGIANPELIKPEIQTNLLKMIISIFQEKIFFLSEKHLVHAILLRTALDAQMYKTTIKNYVHLLLDGFSYEKQQDDSVIIKLKHDLKTYENLRRIYDSQIIHRLINAAPAELNGRSTAAAAETEI
ncbi:unnamed protein product [Adineta steineri]|uniref:Uncharacterized protein n=1 Tax=Adineta steineri TaxID=433720 RepID=A0A813W2X1_9BILA|nr:unnamed protein product [Adineta steineri]CAF0859775.1 unnamed protein product [Adineta steineri]CAF0920312.1 unnamed protein product [Adineta steineri]